MDIKKHEYNFKYDYGKYSIFLSITIKNVNIILSINVKKIQI